VARTDRQAGLSEKGATLRRRIVSLLEARILSAKELSASLGIPEKEVYEHLRHVQRAVRSGGFRFDVVPAACRACGFAFRKRDRLTSPGKCPVCRGESIADPSFAIRKR
jgi:transcriptional regulator